MFQVALQLLHHQEPLRRAAGVALLPALTLLERNGDAVVAQQRHLLVLVKHMASQNEHSQRDAIATLGNVACNGPVAAAQLTAAGVLQPALALLQGGKCHWVRALLHLLDNLAFDTAAVEVMVRQGLPATLRALLSSGKLCEEGVVYAQELLADLQAALALGLVAPQQQQQARSSSSSSSSQQPAAQQGGAGSARGTASQTAGARPSASAPAEAAERCLACQVAACAERKLRRCAGCRAAWYCSAACQKEDWKRHKVACKAAAAAATAAAGGAQ
jgi:hypothetical protein